jgi:F0F1-type ATP synthase assembly protein I
MTDGTAVTPLGRRGLILVALGLLLQLLATFYWTPATFILSAVLGVGMVVAGAATFAWGVWRARRHPGAGSSPAP